MTPLVQERALCPPRRQRDAQLMPEIQRVWQANFSVYGADMVWKQLRREKLAATASPKRSTSYLYPDQPTSGEQAMRFIITAQSSAEKETTERQSDFDVELFKSYMRFNEEMHQAGVLVASEGLKAAPTWSASAWQPRNAN